MIVAKQVADLITTIRALIAVCLMWLGITHKADGLSLAAGLMIADWIGDMVDGRIARRSRRNDPHQPGSVFNVRLGSAAARTGIRNV